jgi:hypothetical protein
LGEALNVVKKAYHLSTYEQYELRSKRCAKNDADEVDGQEGIETRMKLKCNEMKLRNSWESALIAYTTTSTCKAGVR